MMNCPKCGTKSSKPNPSMNWRFDEVYMCENKECEIIEFAVSYPDGHPLNNGQRPTKGLQKQ